MKVSFGLGFGSIPVLLRGPDAPAFMDLVRMAEGYGVEAIGTYDSAFLGGDAYVRATLLALASTRAAVGLRPSNPLTREPQVMASFLASLAPIRLRPSWSSASRPRPCRSSTRRSSPRRLR